jgi:3-hydroxybutyrate dehydrogenase
MQGDTFMLKGKVAVVTGSTSGIGLGIATAFAEQGADIVLNGFGDAAEIEKTRAGLAQAHGVKVIYNGADLSKGAAVREMVESAVKQLGRIDILVNNAGIQHTALIEDFPAEKWDAIIALNLSAVFHGSAAALPYMKKQGWGRIINIASAHGLVGSANKSAYVAAKHGVVGLTKVTALETAGLGITANAICPGWVRTALVEKQISAISAQNKVDQEAAARELLGEKQPSLQFVTPEQLGGTAVYLASPAADQVTGTSISVDGGWTAR